MTAGPSIRSRLALVALVGLAIALRVLALRGPVQRDLATYATIGSELLSGRTLYSDLWDHKPPALHAAFALASAAAGAGRPAIVLLASLTAVFSVCGAFAAARKATGSDGTGLLAAALAALVSADWWLQAEEPNAEAFVAAALVWALVFLLDAAPGLPGFWRLLPAALALGTAALFKPNALVLAAAAATWFAFVAAREGRPADAAAGALTLGGIPLLLLFASAIPFLAAGTWPDFRDAVLVYNRAYAGPLLTNLVQGLRPDRLVPWFAPTALVLVAVAASGLGRAARTRDAWTLAAAVAAGTWATVALPGRFFPHYYAVWLPLLAVLAAVALHGDDAPRPAPSMATLVLLAALAAQNSFRPAESWSTRRWWGGVHRDAQAAGRALDALLAPSETFYLWGADTGIYLESRRRPPTGVFYSYPLTQGPLFDRLLPRVLADLRRNRPQLVVVERDAPAPPAPLARLLEDGWQELPVSVGARFSVRALRGGRLLGNPAGGAPP